MRLLSDVRCRSGQHEPNRRKVKWNGITYVGHCKHCGEAIERCGHKDWRVIGETEADRRAKRMIKELMKRTDQTVKT